MKTLSDGDFAFDTFWERDFFADATGLPPNEGLTVDSIELSLLRCMLEARKAMIWNEPQVFGQWNSHRAWAEISYITKLEDRLLALEEINE